MMILSHVSVLSASCASILSLPFSRCSFFFNVPATPEIYTLSLHDALPICLRRNALGPLPPARHCVHAVRAGQCRSEEHTSELQSLTNLVCRLLLEKKKKRRENSRHEPPRASKDPQNTKACGREIIGRASVH